MNYTVGLIGAGIQSSRTPALHMREAAHHGLHCDYRLLDVDAMPAAQRDLASLLDDAERQGLAGLNITHPFKQAVMTLLTDLAPEARQVRAVNTVVLRAGKRLGHNTDTTAFRSSINAAMGSTSLAGPAVQMGAGGAGAATAHGLLSLGLPRLALFDPDVERLSGLLHSLEARFGSGRVTAGGSLEEAMRQASGLINASPVGMAKYPGLPLPPGLLRPDLWVADVVYFPRETELLRVARALGCRTLDGAGMAVGQAAESFELFTGVAADRDRMARHFEELG